MKDYLPLASKLFIDLSDEFKLIFDQGNYRLADKFKPFCHYLELCLISDKTMTGDKIKDICSCLNVRPQWVLGFYNGYKSISRKYKDKDYISGYLEGVSLKKRENVQV